jgi:hypothetical protein
VDIEALWPPELFGARLEEVRRVPQNSVLQHGLSAPALERARTNVLFLIVKKN